MATPSHQAPPSPNTPDVLPDPIFQFATGFMSAKLLFIANEVGLFEELADGPAALDELAARTGLPRRTARILADAMVALGLIARTGDLYQNAPLAACYLSRRPLMDLRPFLRFWNRISYQRWTTLEQAVRNGSGVLGVLQFSPEEQKVFSEGVEAFSAGSASNLPAVYDFSRHRRVVDLGGGTGSFLIPLLRKYPHMQCTLFEIPPAAAVARGCLAGTPFAEKIRVAEGDFFQDPVPEGQDAIIMANVIHVFLPGRNLELLRRIRRQAPPGACLLLVACGLILHTPSRCLRRSWPASSWSSPATATSTAWKRRASGSGNPAGDSSSTCLSPVPQASWLPRPPRRPSRIRRTRSAPLRPVTHTQRDAEVRLTLAHAQTYAVVSGTFPG